MESARRRTPRLAAAAAAAAAAAQATPQAAPVPSRSSAAASSDTRPAKRTRTTESEAHATAAPAMPATPPKHEAPTPTHNPPAPRSLFSSVVRRESLGSAQRVDAAISAAVVSEQRALDKLSRMRVIATIPLFEDRSRVQCLAAHATLPFVCAGGKEGGVALWRFPAAVQSSEHLVALAAAADPSAAFDADDMGDQLAIDISHECEKPRARNTHDGRVSDVKFLDSSSAAVQTLSCGYDGTAWLHDWSGGQASYTTLLLQSVDAEKFTSCGVLAARGAGDARHTVMLADEGGRAYLRDTRSPSASAAPMQLHRRKIGALAVHPREHDVFCTAAADGPVLCMWDLRHCAQPVTQQSTDADQSLPIYKSMQTRECARVVKHLEFSPRGDRLVATALDSTLRIFNSCGALNAPQHCVEHAHCNDVGIWIADFRPSFVPWCDSLVLSGELQSHALGVYSALPAHWRRSASGARKQALEMSDAMRLKATTSLAIAHNVHDQFVFSCAYQKLFLWA